MFLSKFITFVPLVVQIACASPLLCPFSTKGVLFFFRASLSIDLKNLSCTDSEVDQMNESIERVLQMGNGTMPDGSTVWIHGDLCDTDRIEARRHMLLTSSFTVNIRLSK